jgi:Winged helix DNA-binding domain
VNPPSPAITRREVNRALLARQHLLERVPLPAGAGRAERVVAETEHLLGLQAQAPFPPYYGLWSRLDGFAAGDLAELLTSRAVVRIAVMRSTIHLVSAADCLPLRRLTQPVTERSTRTTYAKQLAGVDLDELGVAGRELVDQTPMTFAELGAALAPRWPDNPPNALAQGVRAMLPLVQVPPRAVWGKSGLARHTSAHAWLGPAAADGGMTAAGLVRRYLASFGPASVRDVQAWSGLTGLRAAAEELRPSLVTFTDESGTELFDLPDAPRPGGDVPAPVRLAAEFDNLVLGHADRTRVISDSHRKLLYTVNGIFPGTVLTDGFVTGQWRITSTRGGAALAVDLFTEVPARTRKEIEREAQRALSFAAPGGAHDFRFGPLRG